MSIKQKNPATPLLSDCNPQQNILLKKHGMRGIIVAVSVSAVVLLVIMISKWNDVRQQRVPAIWKNRLRGIIKDCAASLNLAKETDNREIATQHIIEAKTILDNAKKIAGTTDLAKVSGFDLKTLEDEIETLSNRFIQIPIPKNKKSKENKPKFETIGSAAARLDKEYRKRASRN